MDIMKNKLHLDKVEVQQHQSKTTDDLQDKRNISFQEEIALKHRMSIGTQIDQLMPPVHEGGDNLQKAPVNKNIYFPEDYAKTIQELIAYNYGKTIEEYRDEIKKQKEEVDTYQTTFDRYELQILEYTAKANEATNEADKADFKALVENIKELKTTLEIDLRKKKSAFDELKIKILPQEKDQAVLEYGKKLPETLEDLWKKKDAILDSKNTQEKKNFLEEVSKISQFLKDLDTISNYGTKKDKRFYDIVSKIDEKLVDISGVAAQVAGQLIDFEQLKKDHHASLIKKREKLNEIVGAELDFDLVDQEIEMKKSLINALNRKLGQPVKYPNVAITQEAKQEVKDIVRRTDKKILKVILQSYVDANIQIISDLLQHKNKTVEDGKNLKTEMYARAESLDIIEKGKNIHDWVKDIVNNQQNVLDSEDLKDKYQFIANVMRMDQFLHFTPIDPSSMTSDEKLFLSLVDFVRIHKRQLEDTARQVTVQIFNKLNPNYQEPKLNLTILNYKLDQREDEIALLDTDIKYKMYNPLENIKNTKLEEADDKRDKISNRKNRLTAEQKFNFRAKLSEEKTDCILAYEKLYQKVKGQLTEMLTDVSANEKEDLAIFIASLSESVQKITAIDKINPEVTLSWADDIDVYEVAAVVRQKYKDKGIDIDHVNDIEKQKIVKLRTYEKRLWNDQKYGSSSMEEMYLNIGKKAVEQADLDKKSKLKGSLMEKVLVPKWIKYHKETNEDKKKRLKQEFEKANKVFESFDDKYVKNLIDLKKSKDLLQNKAKKKDYIEGIERLEAYKRGLTAVVDFELKDSADYQNVINAIDLQLNKLAKTTAQVAFSFVDFDEVESSYQTAIGANEEEIKASIDKNGTKIEELSQQLELVEFQIYVIQALQAGIIGDKDIENDITRVPAKYQKAAKEFYQSIMELKGKDLNDTLEYYGDLRDDVKGELKNCTESIKDNQKQVKKRTEEARLLGRSRELFDFTQNLTEEKKRVLASEDVKDKAAFLDKIVDIKNLCFILSEGCSIKFENNNRHLEVIGRYFANQSKQLEAAAREVVSAMDNLLIKDYQLPEISLSDTLSKLKDTKRIDQMVQTMAVYKSFNLVGQLVDNRAKDINDFMKDFALSKIKYSTEQQLTIVKELIKQRKEVAKEFNIYYETLKTKYAGQISDACIGFIATQSKEHQMLMAFNELNTIITQFIDGNPDVEVEYPKEQLRAVEYAREDLVAKGVKLSEDARIFENKLMNSRWDAGEFEKIYLNFITKILDNALERNAIVANEIKEKLPEAHQQNEKIILANQENQPLPEILVSDEVENALLNKIRQKLDNEKSKEKKDQEKITQLEKEEKRAVDILARAKDIPKLITHLMEAQQQVYASADLEEKKQFLNQVEELAQFIEDLEVACKYEIPQNDNYKNTMIELNGQMDRLAETVAKVAFQVIDFNAVKNIYRSEIHELQKQRVEAERIEKKNAALIQELNRNVQLHRTYFDLLDMKRDGYLLNVSKEEVENRINSMPADMKENINAFKKRIKKMSVKELNKLCKEIGDLESSNEDALNKIKKQLGDIKFKIKLRNDHIKNIESIENIMTVNHDLEIERDAVLKSQDLEKKCDYLNKVSTLGIFTSMQMPGLSPVIEQNSKYFYLSQRYIKMCHKKASETASQIGAQLARQLVEPVEEPVIDIQGDKDRLLDGNNIKQMFITTFNFMLYNGVEEPENVNLKDIYQVKEDLLEDKLGFEAEHKIAFLKEIQKERIKVANELVAIHKRVDDRYGKRLGKGAVAYIACRSQAYAKWTILQLILRVASNWGTTNVVDKEYNKFLCSKFYRANLSILDATSGIDAEREEFSKLVWPNNSEKDEVFEMYKEANNAALRRAFEA